MVDLAKVLIVLTVLVFILTVMFVVAPRQWYERERRCAQACSPKIGKLVRDAGCVCLNPDDLKRGI